MRRHHPDLKGSQAANRFVKIQEAYEVVTGKRRGSTVEETKQAAKTGTWDFHDWYALSLHQCIILSQAVTEKVHAVSALLLGLQKAECCKGKYTSASPVHGKQEPKGEL